VKNPVREHGASSIEKAIHPSSEERGILAFSRKAGCSYRLRAGILTQNEKVAIVIWDRPMKKS
jgi:hypothetical protein